MKFKIVVTVPENEADKLREAIDRAGGGKLGNYVNCSFSITGTGRFLPVDGADPTIGEVGKLEAVAEERIEVTCDEDSLQTVVQSIRDAHTYEEPSIDVYQLFEL